MIKAEFFIKSEMLIGFKVKNHSGYSENGTDIVCSAVSSAVQMAINTITEVVLVKTNLTVDENKAVISIKINDENSEKMNLFHIIVKGLFVHLKNIQEDYKEYIHIKITEV